MDVDIFWQFTVSNKVSKKYDYSVRNVRIL